MKRVLITGENGYIGNSLKSWLERRPDEYRVEMVGVRDDKWKSREFDAYDCVVHAAAVVHKKESLIGSSVYEAVNHRLAVEVYKKCEECHVKQFIFISTAGVYEEEDDMYHPVKIDQNSRLGPHTEYGKSKLRAEKEIQTLYQKNGITKAAVVRPPLVYGPGCPGNYGRLAKLSKKLFVIPNIKNQKSMIYIDNLCEFFRILIEKEMEGVFLPQNSEYVCTTELMEKIAKVHGKQPFKTKLFNPFIKLMSKKMTVFSKIYGDNIFDWKCSEIGVNYCLVPFDESVVRTEQIKKDKTEQA